MQRSSISPKNTQTRSARHFCLTLNQVDRFKNLKQYFEGLKTLTFGVAAKEIAPRTKHEHIHIYIQFKASVRLSLEKLCGAHVEAANSDPKKCYKYTVKGGDIIWMHGSMRKYGCPTIAEVESMSYAEIKQLPVIYYNIARKIKSMQATSFTSETLFKKVQVYFLYGPSSLGKTTFAKHLLEGRKFDMVKYRNGFWIGPTDNPEVTACLYDDWRQRDMPASEFIQFGDYNRQIMNIKGDVIANNYDFVVITTVEHPDEIYKDSPSEDRYQWMRRFKFINFSIVYNDDREKHLRYLCIVLTSYIRKFIYNKLFKNNHIKTK